jgi:CRISPR/Cas system CSM-associated protein Csm3 (group 7 of RAMP superfamily)
MAKPLQDWRKSRQIVERIIVEGDLILSTPAHFGSGDEGDADLSLLRDALDGSALLPGASIAGALRNYLRERKWGYGAAARNSDLFGGKRGAKDEEEGDQSLLVVEDAISRDPMQIELRDGVGIDAETRTAAQGKLFDMEVLRAGTRFPLRFELLIDERNGDSAGRRERLCRDLALALNGLEKDEICLGARKRRGFGRCRVDEWHVRRFGLLDTDGLLAWLAEGRDWVDAPTVPEAIGGTLAEKLGVTSEDIDRRYRFEIDARFALDGSLLVRSGAGRTDLGPDMEHLHRTPYDRTHDKSGEREPILPGTSLAGALRARALRIANTLTPDRIKAGSLIDAVFGVGPEDVTAQRPDDEQKHWASRLVTYEAAVEGVQERVQNRIRVDRFTGGAMDNYLFSEAPVFGDGKSFVDLKLVLRGRAPDPDKPHEARGSEEYEIGLLLLLLKDLWTGDLPLGGESSVGRGRLRGVSATLRQVTSGGITTWQIEQQKDRLHLVAEPEQTDVWQSLEQFVVAFGAYLAGR